MRNLIIKLLLKIIGDRMFHMEQVDEKKMAEWLYNSYENKGYSSYYTIRKKTITNLMAAGIERDDYIMLLGRLQELKALNQNIKQQAKLNKQQEILIEKKKKKTNP